MAETNRWRLHEREHEQAEIVHRREHDAEDRALRLAADSVDHRLEQLNELRSEVLSDRAQYLRTDAYEAEHKALRALVDSKVETVLARLDTVEKLLDQAQGAVSTWRFIALFAGLPGLAALVIGISTILNSSP